MEEKVIDTIISTKTEEVAEEFGATIESSAYINGEYDWSLTFTADDIIQAKSFLIRCILSTRVVLRK